MKKIEAIIRPNRLAEVRDALTEVGITGMIILEASGIGREKGHIEIYRGIEYMIDFIPKIKIELVVEEEILEDCLNAITEAGRTDKIGDGKIFVSHIERVLRIRTGESNKEAM